MKIIYKVSLLSLSSMVLSIAINAHATSREDEQETKTHRNTHMSNIPPDEGCRYTYLPTPMRYVGSDPDRDVALYRPENHDTFSQRFWKIVGTYKPDTSNHK